MRYLILGSLLCLDLSLGCERQARRVEFVYVTERIALDLDELSAKSIISKMGDDKIYSYGSFKQLDSRLEKNALEGNELCTITPVVTAGTTVELIVVYRKFR